MRAIVSDGKTARVELRHPNPQPATGDAVIRLRRGLVSAFDTLTAAGRTGFAGVMGHQFVGEVETVHGDSEASRRLVHQRVVGSIISSCGECDLCRKGLSQHCRKRTLMGICGRDGCFAERFALPARQLVTVPPSVDDDRAVFTFEIAAALHTAQQLTIANRPYITILGDGVSALITGQVLSKLNASVRVVGADPDRLDLCSKWNVKSRLLDDVGRRNDQDIVIDCTADGAGLAAALTLVRPRGKVVLKSFTHQPIVPGSLDVIMRSEIEVIGSSVGVTSDALTALVDNTLDVVSLISKRSTLRDGVAALRQAPATLLSSDE